MGTTSFRASAVVLIGMSAILITGCTQRVAPEAVAPQNSLMKNSPMVSSEAAAATTEPADQICYWNDKKYSDGAQVCESGQRHKCWNGKWVDIGNC